MWGGGGTPPPTSDCVRSASALLTNCSSSIMDIAVVLVAMSSIETAVRQVIFTIVTVTLIVESSILIFILTIQSYNLYFRDFTRNMNSVYYK